MSHLSPERLAALLDEQPTAAELAHLASCRPCSRERGAYEALSAMSRGVMAIGQPLTTWDRLAPALERDGVIENGRAFGRRGLVSRRWLQAAAAVLLMVGGMAMGRMTSPAVSIPMAELNAVSGNAETSFASLDEARRVAARSQSIYQASMAFIAGHDSMFLAPTPAAIKTRLAALDQVTQVAGAALENAPYDSVINTIYLNAQGQREASMRMLNAASMRVTTY